MTITTAKLFLHLPNPPMPLAAELEFELADCAVPSLNPAPVVLDIMASVLIIPLEALTVAVGNDSEPEPEPEPDPDPDPPAATPMQTPWLLPQLWPYWQYQLYPSSELAGTQTLSGLVLPLPLLEPW